MGANESGEAITIHFDKPTLVYVFRPGCGWCDKNYDNAKEIVLRASARFRVIAATAWPVNSSPERRTTLLTYLQKYPLAAEVVSIDPASLDQHFVQSFGTTPQLLIFNERGQITKTWAGALMGSRQSDAERFFGFSLPGIRQ